MNRRGKRWLAWCLAAGLVLGGCWDRIEVEHRAFVMGVAVDRAPEEFGEGKVSGPGISRLRLTFQIANPVKLAGGGKESGGDGGGAPAELPFWNLVTISPGIFLAVREVSTRLDRIPYFEHLQVVVLGEDIARQGLEPVLDFFRRNGEMHGRVEVAVAQGEAQKVLAVTPRLQPLPALYLVDLIRIGERRTGHHVPGLDLTQVFGHLAAGTSLVLPRVVAGKQEVKVAGGAVVRRGRLVGWMGETEAEGYRWLVNQARGVVVGAPGPQGQALDAFEVWHAQTRLVPQVVGGRLRFTVIIETEGDLSEHLGGAPAATADYLAGAQREVGRTITRRVQAAVKRLQSLKADAAGFGQEVERRHPRLWQRLKDRWEEEIFPNLPVEVVVRVRIRQVGLYR